MDQPAVSIICNAYNHEAYIRYTLESFLKQKTDFPFEILVHDDASTDKTAEIIRDYEKKYPEIIFPVYQTENQYSKGVRITFDVQLPRARGKYIALCEGDDYWTDENKLQKQVDALEAHPQADICAASAYEVNEETGAVIAKTAPSEEDKVISAEEVIAGDGGYVATCSLLIRTELLKSPAREFAVFPYDYTMQIMGSLRGGMVYLADFMCAHRSFSKNSWTSKIRRDISKRTSVNERAAEMLKMLDEDTQGKYSGVIKDRIGFYMIDSKYITGGFREIKRPPLRETYLKMPFSYRLKVNLHIYLSFVFTIRKKLLKGK